jgi:hypothetical protein
MTLRASRYRSWVAPTGVGAHRIYSGQATLLDIRALWAGNWKAGWLTPSHLRRTCRAILPPLRWLMPETLEEKPQRKRQLHETHRREQRKDHVMAEGGIATPVICITEVSRPGAASMCGTSANLPAICTINSVSTIKRRVVRDPYGPPG